MIIIKLLSNRVKEKILKGAKNLATPTKTCRLERTFPMPYRPVGVSWCQWWRPCGRTGSEPGFGLTNWWQTRARSPLPCTPAQSRSWTAIEGAGVRPHQTGIAVEAQSATMRPMTATAMCVETSTNRNAKAAADDTLVEMAVRSEIYYSKCSVVSLVRSTHLAWARSADSGHASWGQKSDNIRTSQCPRVKQASGTMGLGYWLVCMTCRPAQ